MYKRTSLQLRNNRYGASSDLNLCVEAVDELAGSFLT